MDFTADAIIGRIPYVILLLLSLTVHEFAHAWSAWKLGDDTASLQGRMTLNPFAHVEPIGTLVLPLVGIPFGWAKPVPVNPARFNRGVTMGGGMAITAVAGPISNVLVALAAAVGLRLTHRYLPAPPEVLLMILYYFLNVNVGLAIFNLIPLPPLDGSRIVAWLMPYRMRDAWHRLEQISPALLLGVIYFGRDLISGPVLFFSGLLVKLVHLIA